MTTAPSQRPGYFAALYDADPDPWRFETSAYEAAKYAASIAALGERRYASALEVGCSIGVLTEQLARWCDRLLAVDVATVALEAARVRCAGLAHVDFALSALPDVAPAGPFDLIILSEVLYYFDRNELARLAAALKVTMAPECTLMLVHWLGPTPDYPLDGDEATTAFTALLHEVEIVRQDRQDEYRLDLLRVARR